MSSVAAAILAGGKNTRMQGRNKAFLLVRGVPIITRNLEILSGLFKETIIVTNSPGEFSAFEKNSTIVTDRIKNCGPLGGIYSALSITKKRAVFFTACDMPNLNRSLIKRLVKYFEVSDFDAVLPRINLSVEYLYGIYRKELKEKLKICLAKGKDYSVRGFLATVKVGYLDLKDTPLNRRIFSNLNTPQDLEDLSEG